MRGQEILPSGDPEDDTGNGNRQLFLSATGAFRNFRSSFSSARLSPAIDLGVKPPRFRVGLLLRKEVIQPHLPIRLPCYDFTPVIDLTLAGWPLAVTSPVSGAINSHGVTGGVYKARERIHRGMLIRDY